MKALGGCSAMNAMIYIRGNRADYDAWRDQYGAAGWGYDEVLPYFVKAESNSRYGGPLHGQAGPLHGGEPRWAHRPTPGYGERGGGRGPQPHDGLKRGGEG